MYTSLLAETFFCIAFLFDMHHIAFNLQIDTQHTGMTPTPACRFVKVILILRAIVLKVFQLLAFVCDTCTAPVQLYKAYRQLPVL